MTNWNCCSNQATSSTLAKLYALALMVKSSLGLLRARGDWDLDHSKSLIVLIIVTSAILGYLALNNLLAPQATPPGPTAPQVTPAPQ